jgi:hypothetical protein
MNSFSKISSSEEEAKEKKLPKPTVQKGSHRTRSQSSLGSKTESLIFDFPIKNIDNNINIESGNGTLNFKNFTNVDDSIFRKGNVEKQNKNNNFQNPDNLNDQKENYSDSFGKEDIPNLDKNFRFFPNNPNQYNDLITALNNNTQLGQQILLKMDEMINKNSEANGKMADATLEMKKSNEIQKQMLALLTELMKKIPEPKKEGEQNNTNK